MVKKTKKNSVIGKSIELAVKNNQPVVSSLVVAEHFNKLHKNVLRDIAELEIPEEFNGLNFEPVKYFDEKGEQRPAFNITRDGFTILAMGFTGKKAMEWKLRYIEAFNTMEKKLIIKLPIDPLRLTLNPAPSDEIQAFKGMVHYWGYLEGVSGVEAEACMANALRVPKLELIDLLTIKSGWDILKLYTEALPSGLEQVPCCDQQELEPIHGLLTYWAYQTDQNREELSKSVCDTLRIPSFDSLPKPYRSHAISYIWKKLNCETGKRDALKENSN